MNEDHSNGESGTNCGDPDAIDRKFMCSNPGLWTNDAQCDRVRANNTYNDYN